MGVLLRGYISGHGHRDGWRGFCVSALWAFYRLVTLANQQWLESIGTRARVEEIHGHNAERLLNEYGKARTAVKS